MAVSIINVTRSLHVDKSYSRYFTYDIKLQVLQLLSINPEFQAQGYILDDGDLIGIPRIIVTAEAHCLNRSTCTPFLVYKDGRITHVVMVHSNLELFLQDEDTKVSYINCSTGQVLYGKVPDGVLVEVGFFSEEKEKEILLNG